MYTESPTAAAPYRARILTETAVYIAAMRADADARRAAYFAPDTASPEAYAASLAPYRRELFAMLGRPLTEVPDAAPALVERTLLDDADDGRLERIVIECVPGLCSCGLLFTPKTPGPHPYVTALHGGLGTPEIVSSVYPSANYNDLVQRIRRATGAIVWAPQLILWDEKYATCDEEKQNHIQLDYHLKQVGGSLAALEVFKLMRSVDWLCANLPIDPARMGIAGLSYGGFYTLLTAACDVRYKAALSSGFFNDRYAHCWGDWHWFDSASRFLDGELAALVCPRALCIEVGERDNLFRPEPARALAAKVADIFVRIGCGDSFRFVVHPCTHEFCRDDANVAWFADKLLG